MLRYVPGYWWSHQSISMIEKGGKVSNSAKIIEFNMKADSVGPTRCGHLDSHSLGLSWRQQLCQDRLHLWEFMLLKELQFMPEKENGLPTSIGPYTQMGSYEMLSFSTSVLIALPLLFHCRAAGSPNTMNSFPFTFLIMVPLWPMLGKGTGMARHIKNDDRSLCCGVAT